VSDNIDGARSVQRMLELLKMEFPNYASDNDEMIAAAIAMAHVCGAIGAIVLLKGGETRLDKMVRMLAKNTINTAHEGAKAIQGKKLQS
jgi:hypothetical protein